MYVQVHLAAKPPSVTLEEPEVRSLAEGRVGDGWASDFAEMLDSARGKGWLDDAGEAIRAHVEWDVPT